MPTLRRLLRRLIGLDSANSGNLPTTDERVDQLTAELAHLRETLGTQLESFNRDAIARDVNLCVRIEVLEKLAAAAPSVFNLNPSEN